MQEELYYYWLDNVPGIGRLTARRLLELTTPRQLFREGAKREGLPLTQKQIQLLEEHRRRWNLEKEWQDLQRKGIHFFCISSSNYPPKLKKIPDPPIVLYQKGKAEYMNRPAVAIVGARDCSAYGGYHTES